jgi:hypothetical protein
MRQYQSKGLKNYSTVTGSIFDLARILKKKNKPHLDKLYSPILDKSVRLKDEGFNLG